MNKKTLRLFAAVALLSAFTACNNDEQFDPLANGPVPMSFVADINSVATRAPDTGFDADDVVGIIPVKDGDVEIAQANIAYTYGGSEFTADPSYYFQNTEEVTFNAYYPYDANLEASTWEIAIDTEAVQTDYLFASKTTNVRTPSVSFTGDGAFKHVMTQLTIKLTAGDDIDDLTDASCKAGNFYHSGTFNVRTGAATASTSGTAAPVNFSGTSHTVILLPQAIQDGKLPVTVTYNGEAYKAELSVTTTGSGGSRQALLAGTHYIYIVTVKNTGLEVGEAIIEPWVDEAEDAGDATMPTITN